MRKFLIKKMAIFLTEQCDKKCTYCDIPKVQDPKPPNKQLLEKYLPIIDQSKAFYHYTITGGEPGLVDEDTWDFIFSTLNYHPIRINTNGKFFDRGYYDKYKDKIWQIGLHVDVGEEIPIQICDESVWYYVPVHKKNYTQFIDLVKQHPTLNFSIIPYIHKNLDVDYDEFALTKEEYISIYDQIQDISNIAACTKEMINLIKTTKNIELFRNNCKYNYVQPILDFINGRIGRCVFSYTQNDYLPMNVDNLNELFIGKLDFGDIDTACDICEECFRYFEYYFNNKICSK